MAQLSALKTLIWLLKVLQLSKRKVKYLIVRVARLGFSAIQAIKKMIQKLKITKFFFMNVIVYL